ncbi:MAG: nuclear transport factor 2 family protein [Candidatus Thorarchaeota archaeon]|nr:MAG: nuclear transport factor 2 family protein [Candidatus Thorarchaeota archaeon]
MNEEIVQIGKTVDAYFDAVTNRSWDKILESWHPDARMTTVKEGEVKSMPRSFWEGFCKQSPNPDERIQCELVSVEVHGSVSFARSRTVREDPERIDTLTDFLTLQRQDDGKWLIINKSYHTDSVEKD